MCVYVCLFGQWKLLKCAQILQEAPHAGIKSTSTCLLYFFFHHTTCEGTCDTLASSAANQGDNTVSVAQGGTASPGATGSGSTALSYR